MLIKNKWIKILLPLLVVTKLSFGACTQPNNGGTGVCNNNANTITLGGPINTAGAFTLSGAFSTTLIVSNTSVITLPSGTHTLASNDGSNASGTWGISITGTAAGAPPTGSASGDLTGSYPNPTIANLAVTTGKIANNGVTYSKIQQMSSSNRLLGNLGGATNDIGEVQIAGGLGLTGSGYGTLTTQPMTGDVTTPPESFVTTIASGAVTNSKIANSTIDLTTKVTNALPELNGGTGTDTSSCAVGSLFFQQNPAGTFNCTANLAYGPSGLTVLNAVNAADVNVSNLTASQLTATDSSKKLVSGNLTGDVTSSGFSTTIANLAVTNAKIANSTIDVTTKITGVTPFANGGLGFNTATTGDLFYASGTNTPGKLADVATNQILISGGIGAVPLYSANPRATTLGLGAAVTSPTITSQLNISSTTQNSARIVLSGQEYFASGNSSADGIAFLLGVNRTNNRQLWIGDSALLASSSSNPLFRIVLGGTTSFSAIATDGTTGLALGINTQGGDVTFGANGSGSNVIIGAIGKTLEIKQGTNGCSGTGIVLTAGGATITSTCIAANDTVLVERVAVGGLVGTYTVAPGSGSATVTSSNGADTSTLNWLDIKPAP